MHDKPFKSQLVLPVASPVLPVSTSAPSSMELVAMQDMDSDLLNFDAFFSANNDEEVVDLWDLTTDGHDEDLLDAAELEPLSPQIKEEPHEAKQDGGSKQGLTLDTATANSAQGHTDSWWAQVEADKAVITPTATLPARFSLLSTTCVYEPGFTTSPRGKRRISETRAEAFEMEEDNDDDDEEQSDKAGDDAFALSSDEDYMPEFTDAELSAMVDSPGKTSTTNSAASSPLRNEAMPHVHSSPLSSTGAGATEADSRVSEQDVPDVLNMFNSVYDNSQNFLGAQQQPIDLTGGSTQSLNLMATAGQALFPMVLPFSASAVGTASSSSNPSMAIDYFSPSGYAAAANQFLDSYQQQVQPFFLDPTQATTNVQLAAAMAMANSAAAMNMRKMGASYGVPIAPLQRRAGSLPPNVPIKVTAPLKPRLPVARAASTTSVLPLKAAATTTSANGKVTRLAITPDIADFKLVQIFHQFCDPVTKVLTLSGFQQLLLHHQVKEENSGASSSANDSKHSKDGSCCSSSASPANANAVVTPDAQSLFKVLDINGVGALDLERFMHSFQICNRCTEAKRRAHQALCASQGQTFTPSALERQLMEDVAPVVVRVVPTRFEGHKVKSCEHYQWTWCEGFEKTGNEKCRGTNRHDKCPKYLANCTLWKHKLPPKSRKPKVLLDNVDSPTKKLKYFS